MDYQYDWPELPPILRWAFEDLGDSVEEIPQLPAPRGEMTIAQLREHIGDLTDEEVEAEMAAALTRSSSFGYKLGHIREHLKNKDYQNASLTTKEALLGTLIELVPLAEKSLRESGTSKGIYQFNALLGQVREMLVDLDGERDLNNTMQAILDESIRPCFMLLAQSIIQVVNGLKRQLQSEFDERNCKIIFNHIDEQMKELARYTQGMYNEIQTRIDKKLAVASK